MRAFSEALEIRRGVTAIIGGGGKTSLMLRLAQELAQQGSVIVTTSTHIRPPEAMPILARTGRVEGLCCVASPGPPGKLSPPEQSFAELAELADFVLVEADGSAGLPLKAHLPHEPVIPENADQTILVVGAMGLNRPIATAAHRPTLFSALAQGDLATPEAVARVVMEEHLHQRVVINQVDGPEQLAPARELAEKLGCPTVVACLNKGEIICWY